MLKRKWPLHPARSATLSPSTIASMKLAALALALGAELRGDGDVEIAGVAGIEDAGPDQVTFVANPRYAALARTTDAAAVLVAPDFPEVTASTLRTANPYLAWAKTIQL